MYFLWNNLELYLSNTHVDLLGILTLRTKLILKRCQHTVRSLYMYHDINNVIENGLRLQSDNCISSLFVLKLQLHNLFYQHHWIRRM